MSSHTGRVKRTQVCSMYLLSIETIMLTPQAVEEDATKLIFGGAFGYFSLGEEQSALACGMYFRTRDPPLSPARSYYGGADAQTRPTAIHSRPPR